MSINVKKVKRVLLTSSTQNKEPLKEFNAVDKMPSFRQNGYSLTFDSSNSDYLSIPTEQIIEDGESVIYKGVGDFFIGKRDSGPSNGGNTIANSGNNIQVRISGVSTILYSGIDWDLPYEVRLRRESGINYILFNGQSEIQLTQTDTFIWQEVAKYSTSYRSGTLYGLESKGETFNLEESYGDTITGSDGTVGTINTSHASGLEYIDATMWNKKSFALEFDTANSEYLELGNPNWFTFGDVDIDYTFDVDLNNIVDFSRVLSYIVDSNNQIDLFFGSNDMLRLRISFNSVSILDTLYTITLLSTNSLTIKNGIISINGVEYDKSGNISDTFVGSAELLIACRNPSGTPSDFSNTTARNIGINGETINLTEGLGNKVEGSSGTVGTIYTSHASGTDRINYGVWLKGNDTDGWNPYT